MSLLLILWTYTARSARGQPLTGGLSPLYWELPSACLWVLLLPLIYYFISSHPLRAAGQIGKVLVIHFGLGLLFSWFHLVLNILLSGYLYQTIGQSLDSTNPWCPWTISIRITWRMLFYLLIVTTNYALNFYQGTREKELNNSSLESRLAMLRLEELKIRIDFPFVMGTLSHAAKLIETNAAGALETIVRLGTFFRLIQQQRTHLTLYSWVRLLRSYLRVEIARSDGGIQAKVKIDDVISSERIRGFGLQPMVYHFIQFRMPGASRPYRLLIRLRKIENGFEVILRDNRLWKREEQQLVAGLGETISAYLSSEAYRVNQDRRCIRCAFYPTLINETLKRNLSEDSLPPDAQPGVGRIKDPPQSNLPFGVAVWIGMSLLAGLFVSARETLVLFANGKDLSWQEVLNYNALWFAWGLLVPAILWFSKKVELNGAKSVFHHSAFGFLLIILFIGITTIYYSRGSVRTDWTDLFVLSSHRLSYPSMILVYWVIVLLANAVWYYQKNLDQQIRTARLQAHLSNAQLTTLEMQLHPHFLFNTLHTINGLIIRNQNEAALMLKRLQRFLQMTLRPSNQHLVPLKQELEFLTCYLDIQKIRFEDRLQLRMEIEPETLSLPVPQLILQPIVENAIRHGIHQDSISSEILLQARRQNDHLLLAVQDNGPGLPQSSDSSRTRKGIGLQNSARRLHQIYGESHSFYFGNRTEGGFEVKMEIPVDPALIHS